MKSNKNTILTLICIACLILTSLNLVLFFNTDGKLGTDNFTVKIWVPSDTIKYQKAFQKLETYLLQTAGGWNRYFVNGAWIDPKDSTTYKEDGYTYNVSLWNTTTKTVRTKVDSAESIVKGSVSEGGFGQIESYVEITRFMDD
jgi:hypothetical protein